MRGATRVLPNATLHTIIHTARYHLAVYSRLLGLPKGELDAVIAEGVAFRTSGCPGKFAPDVSACDRPYGDSPPSNIASYPFPPNKNDIGGIRKQLGMARRPTAQ